VSVEAHLQDMEKCLEILPEEQKRSVDLFYLKEKSYREVADMTGYEMNKVKSYIQNGKRNLKICMEQQHASQA
jgi:RNA polymerase sigma-70 factor (ECF subfamily)